MRKIPILLAIVIFLIIQTEPAFCGISRTMSFQLSVTIPEHVMTNNNISALSFSNKTYQIVQTQTVVRNNKTISLTSIVVP